MIEPVFKAGTTEVDYHAMAVATGAAVASALARYGPTKRRSLTGQIMINCADDRRFRAEIEIWSYFQGIWIDFSAGLFNGRGGYPRHHNVITNMKLSGVGHLVVDSVSIQGGSRYVPRHAPLIDDALDTVAAKIAAECDAFTTVLPLKKPNNKATVARCFETSEPTIVRRADTGVLHYINRQNITSASVEPVMFNGKTVAAATRDEPGYDVWFLVSFQVHSSVRHGDHRLLYHMADDPDNDRYFPVSGNTKPRPAVNFPKLGDYRLNTTDRDAIRQLVTATLVEAES